LIKLDGIRKSFGDKVALDHVSLRAAPGSIHGVIGENGAGKSTLMKILTGLVRRDAGRIAVGGREVAMSGPGEAAALGIGMLHQEPLDFPRLSVLDNFMAASARSFGGRRRQGRRFRELCRSFGFRLDPGVTAGSLTVGERRQVELLRLVRDDCRTLILDEPTTGTTESQKARLFSLLGHLRRQGRTILLVSHKLADIHALCDRVTVLRQGKTVLEAGAPLDGDTLLAAMFGSVPTGRDVKVETPAPGRPILEMEGVCSSLGRSGLRHVSVRVREGEVVGLAGLDGAGQAAFLRLAFGLVRPERGRVRCPLAGGAKSLLAFLPADRLREGLIAGLSIREHHLLAGGSPLFLGRASGRERARRAIDEFSIKGGSDDTVEGLSGGNQQRLLLSLIPAEARLLLLEHPTRGLDVHSSRWTWRYLRRRLPADGAMIFSSPDLDEIMEQAGRVLVFHGGRVTLDAPVDIGRDRICRAMAGAEGAA